MIKRGRHTGQLLFKQVSILDLQVWFAHKQAKSRSLFSPQPLAACQNVSITNETDTMVYGTTYSSTGHFILADVRA